jgi:ERCC4-related helicase
MHMAIHDEQAKIICPCCRATLVLDRDTLSILYFTEHREKAGGASFDQALKELKEKERQMSSRFQQAITEEKQRRALLDKKFRELQKHAAEHPDEGPPLRPFDLE